MSYKKATEIIPAELLEQLQQHIDGEYLYIPKLDDKKKKWGENTRSKEVTKKRNMDIYRQYILGTSTKELAKIYFLSQKTIQKIIADIKRNGKDCD